MQLHTNFANKFYILGSKYQKSEASFLKVNRQVEQLCGMVFTVAMKIFLQLIMLPKCIASFAIYFYTDAGIDSFELPYPLW